MIDSTHYSLRGSEYFLFFILIYFRYILFT
nr:MAG TPA: hypothetical protein [Caudoviricetes sp.]